MNRFKKLMVSLDLNETDSTLIQYAGFISNMAHSSEICFVHITDTFDIPEEIKKVYPEIVSPVDEAAKARMKELVSTHFNGHSGTELAFEAIEGTRVGSLLSFSKSHDIDLIIVGQSTGQSSNLSEKLARKAPCSVLIIPQRSYVKLDTILAAVDFSDHSMNTLDVASAFAKAGEVKFIDILHTYDIPKGYYKTGKSVEEFDRMMLENAKKKARVLFAKADLKGMEIKPYFRKTDNTVEGIQRFAEQSAADLIVLGARGRTGDMAAILLGSVTEGLIRKLDRPLLAVKTKGEGMGLLDALYAL
ncbi:MAG: universal stress protein [Desulfobacteraceae bacterium]|nr:MAG: universal stress protein [Desulfobacteraceae bacterium]